MAARTSPDDSADNPRPSLADVTDAVRELVEVMRSNGLTELDVTSGSVEIRLRAPKSGGSARASREGSSSGPAPSPVHEQPSGHVVTAPMIGTFYASPTPGDPPFVRLGDAVHAGQTIGIIEAMKIMNEIVADRAGVVVEIIANNAQAVEYGSPLLRLDTNRDADE
jgi:acetyl-CoA carboxylase biotin carboxyl carrier protein